MCLLCYFEPNAEIEIRDLENACYSNPDGFGFSILKPTGEIITEKSMNHSGLIDQFLEMRKSNPNSHSIFHARIATAGAVDLENCHPFNITGLNAVIGHNGHLPVQIEKNDSRSDSRIFAESILPNRISAVDSFKGIQKLEKWAGSSKLVILNGDSRLSKPVYFLNEDLGHWKNGAWFSNWSYCDFNNYENIIGGRKLDWFSACPSCESFCSDDSWDIGFCEFCFSCLDCLSDWEDCLCYTKSNYGEKTFYELEKHETNERQRIPMLPIKNEMRRLW
jgi:glutamine amidotransferase